MIKVNARNMSLGILALVSGFMLMSQKNSLESVSTIFSREAQNNAFQEIIILRRQNEGLRSEIEELTVTIDKLSDQESALSAIESEIDRYKKLSGDFPIFGSGLTIEINGDLSTAWMNDLVNAIFVAGGQAVSINGIRLTNQTIGFDTLPQGQIYLNGSVLAKPYKFSVIGDPEDILDILDLPGGIFPRLRANFPNIKIQTVVKSFLQIN